MPWKPSYPGEKPTLGHIALNWMIENLARPDKMDYEPFYPTSEQYEFLLGYYEIDPRTGKRLIRRGVLSRPRGAGKALALDTKLPTPTGWTTIEEVAVGDALFDEQGKPCHVLAKSPVWLGETYEVVFSDGQTYICSPEHLWTVYRTDKHTTETLSVAEMVALGVVKDAKGEKRFNVPSPAPLDLPTSDLSVDPYVLGAWLGDGSKDDGRISGIDMEIFEFIAAAGYKLGPYSRARCTVKGLKAQLRDLGVLRNKHVPVEYLRASYEQRLALVQGLMDTDGGIDPRSKVSEFTTTSPALRDAMCDLLAGLGLKFTVSEGRATLYGKDCGPKWRFNFTARDDVPVYRLTRKRKHLRNADAPRALYRSRRIVAINPMPEQPTQCIEVDSPSHLFLAGEKMTPTHNSPFLAAIGVFEALGECVPDGWDADGQPVGKPWRTVRRPLIQFAAATEQQTMNAWRPLLDMVSTDAPLHSNYPGVEPFQSQVVLPYGTIEPITASTTSTKGNPACLVLADQTEQWLPSNGGVALAEVLMNNTTKVAGSIIESPNAYIPGLGSQAEKTATTWAAMKEGRQKLDKGLFYDHREAPPETELMDRESLVAGLRYAYGDASAHPDGCVLHDPPCDPGWVDLDRIVARVWDDDADEQVSRSDFLNQITFASDAWVGDYEWRARRYDVVNPGGVRVIDKSEPIVLGFDGSRGRAKGKPDATALVACTVKDGYIWPIQIWEAQDRAELWADWEPPLGEIEATIDQTFKDYHVVGFFADPARDWRSYVNVWEAKYGSKLIVKSSATHPIEWWMLGGRAGVVEQAVEELESAIRLGEMTHSGHDRLTAHVLNACRRITHGKLALGKDSSGSIRKIDGAVAAVLAWRARQMAVAKGLAFEKPRRTIPKRIR